MRFYIRKLLIVLSAIFLSAISFEHSIAQVKVSLQFDESAKSYMNRFLFCDKDYNCGLYSEKKSKTSKIDGLEIPIKVWRTGKNFYLLIDANSNNKLTDEKKILLKNSLKVTVKIKRDFMPEKFLFLPFEISHEIYKKDGRMIDKFKLTQHYAFTGSLIYKNCSSKISFSDMNFDGKIDFSDAAGGTNFQIDKNNDGKFWGTEEHNKSSEIIEFCGQNFLVSSLTNDNVTLTPTDLQIVKVGEPVPQFSLVLLKGETLSSDSLKGKNYVLDFWATWCVPCIKNIPQINNLRAEFGKNISVISVNVDVSSRRNLADEIIQKYQLTDFSVIRGLGDDDPIWKTFGGANQSKLLTIPLYVFVDKNGIVRYVGSGGEKLSELKSSIEKSLSNQ